MNKAVEVAFIIVNYNTIDLLQACLQSIISHSPINYEIIVVDNNSNDGSSKLVQTEFPSVHLIQNKENAGYPKAANQGLRAVTANYYFILNSDILLLKNSVATLHQYLSQKPKTGIVAPAQKDRNGGAILSIHQFPNLWREWVRNLFFTDVWRYRIQGEKYADNIKHPVSVDWVMGAAMFVRHEFIADVGLMDEAIFMYGEELDWCFRAHQAGWSVDFVPQATIIHYKSASADKAFSFYRYAKVVRSNYYFFAKHYGFYQLPLFVLAQIIGSFLRATLSALLCLLNRKTFCHQAREHWAVIRASFDINLYKWIIKACKNKTFYL